MSQHHAKHNVSASTTIKPHCKANNEPNSKANNGAVIDTQEDPRKFEPCTSDLYTPEQRARRDSTRWTLVQGILAPLQFFVFLISVCLIARYMISGQGYALATASIVVKTLVLYTIMVTGAIWERVVFGQYLFAKPFFWEDAVSFLVLALHTAYLFALLGNWLDQRALIALAIAAYVSYVINAYQFVRKFRMARKGSRVVSALHNDNNLPAQQTHRQAVNDPQLSARSAV